MSLYYIQLKWKITPNNVLNSIIIITYYTLKLDQPLGAIFPSRIQLKKSGARVPRVELEEMGPSLDVVMRRTHLASADLYKQACKQPKATTKVVFQTK